MARSNSSFAWFAPVCVLALAGCPAPPAPRVDAGRADAPVVPVDTGPPIDVPMTPTDTNGVDVPTTGRVCSLGGGCDVILQNCPTGQGCYLTGMPGAFATACMAIGGTLAEGATCTGLTMCADGLHCSGGADPACREYCCMGSDGDCPTGYSCLNYSDGMGGGLSVGVCVPPADCTVVPNAGCGMDEACAPSADGTLLCVAAGTVAVGGTCGMTMGCVAGATCITVTMAGMMTNTCRSYCRMGMAGDCMGTDTCVMVTGLPAPYGVCFPPG